MVVSVQFFFVVELEEEALNFVVVAHGVLDTADDHYYPVLQLHKVHQQLR